MEEVLLTSNWDILLTNGAVGHLQSTVTGYHPAEHNRFFQQNLFHDHMDHPVHRWVTDRQRPLLLSGGGRIVLGLLLNGRGGGGIFITLVNDWGGELLCLGWW